MPTTSSSGRSLMIFGLLAATVIVTLTSAFLLVSENSRNGKFYLSLAAAIAAECIVFMGPAWLNRRRVTAAVPVHFAFGFVTWGYLLAVACLAGLAALTDTSLNQLAVLHLALLLGLLLAFGAFQMAAGHIEASHADLATSQAGFHATREQFERLSDRVQLIPLPELAALQRSFRKLREDLRCAGAQTLPGAESVECELTASLAGLESSVATLESACGDRDAGRTGAGTAALETWLQQFRLLLRQREERLRALR